MTLCTLVLYFVLVKKPKTRFINEQIFVTDEEQRDKTSVLLKRIFTNPQAWALFFCHFGVVGGYVGFISSWAVPYGMSLYEMTRSDASQLIMVGLIGALIGAPLTSWLASRLDTIKKYHILSCIVLFYLVGLRFLYAMDIQLFSCCWYYFLSSALGMEQVH